MCPIYVFINSTWCHFLTLSTPFITFFNVKSLFLHQQRTHLFFFRFLKAMGCHALSWVSEISQGYGMSRRVLGEWIRPFQRIVVAFVFTSQLLDPWRRRQNVPSKCRELLTQNTAWHSRTEDFYATRLWQAQNFHPVQIRINSSIPGRLSQLRNTTCGICDGPLPTVPFCVAVVSYHEHLSRQFTFSANTIIIADKLAFFVAKFIQNFPLLLGPRAVSRSTQDVELFDSRLY